jgi:hypothetical protein
MPRIRLTIKNTKTLAFITVGNLLKHWAIEIFNLVQGSEFPSPRFTLSVLN